MVVWIRSPTCGLPVAIHEFVVYRDPTGCLTAFYCSPFEVRDNSNPSGDGLSHLNRIKLEGAATCCPRFVGVKLFGPLLLYEIITHCCFFNYCPQVCTVTILGLLYKLPVTIVAQLHHLQMIIVAQLLHQLPLRFMRHLHHPPRVSWGNGYTAMERSPNFELA